MTAAAESSPPASSNLRVATLNLRGQHGDWPARRRVLAAGFAHLDADLVAFQEAVVTNTTDQARQVLGEGYHLVHHKDRDPGGQGVSIASRYPVTAAWEVDLAVTPGSSTATLVAEIAAPSPFGPVLFASHLPRRQPGLEHERELQAAAAPPPQVVPAGRDRHMVVAGDLDADSHAVSIRLGTPRQSPERMSARDQGGRASTRPGGHGHTFALSNAPGGDWDWPFRRIDYLLARCGQHRGPTLAIGSCERIFDQPADGVWASDHFGLAADLTFPPRPDSTP